MKPFEEQFAAWVDGTLEGEELAAFEKRLADHPEAAQEKAEALRLRGLLRAHAAAPKLTNPDFFNYQLRQRLAVEAPRTVRKPERPAIFSWLPRFAWAAVFGLMVGFAVMKMTPRPAETASVDRSNYFAQVVEAWPSDPSISATTVYNARDNVTVVWLDGLDYIPAGDTLL